VAVDAAEAGIWGGIPMRATLDAFWNDEDGVTTMEYALLLVLICIGSLAAFSNLGSGVNDIWEKSVKAVLGK
jgi:Flp pilus assembly pilin Flp